LKYTLFEVGSHLLRREKSKYLAIGTKVLVVLKLSLLSHVGRRRKGY